MKVAVIGAGGVGGIFGGKLQAAGHDVTFVARGAHLEAIRAHGLTVENTTTGAAETIPVRAVADLVKAGMPIFGICLGHQILGQALGGKTFKLKFGHRGGNQPVKDLETGRVEITSQNHGFAVDAASLPAEVAVNRINLNDQTVEGMRHRTKPIFCVQYHPEASPGPHDSTSLFDEFRELVGQRG